MREHLRSGKVQLKRPRNKPRGRRPKGTLTYPGELQGLKIRKEEGGLRCSARREGKERKQ